MFVYTLQVIMYFSTEQSNQLYYEIILKTFVLFLLRHVDVIYMGSTNELKRHINLFVRYVNTF